MIEQIAQALAPLIDRVRTDVTWIKHKGGQARTDEPLTPEALRKHLNGGPARGVTPMKPGQSVTAVALLDLDSHKGETSWADMRAAAARVAEQLRAVGLTPTPFRSSGGKGIHLLMLWGSPQDAYSVRRCLFDALTRAGLTPGAGGVSAGEVEVFPKQDEVFEGRYGNQFILPCGGKGAPLDPESLGDRPRESLVGFTWPMSAPVPVVERPVRSLTVNAPTAQLKLIRAALAAIPDGSESLVRYDPWLRIVHAVHSGSGGDADGLSVLHEWCMRSPLYDPDELDAKWDYARNRPGGITVGTLWKEAGKYGWHEPPDSDDFSVVVPTIPAGEPEAPQFKRDKAGNILPTTANITIALRRPDVCGFEIGFDTFRDELMLSPPGMRAWRSFTDPDYVRLRTALERGGFKTLGREVMRDVVGLVGQENQFDSAQYWLNSLRWDGIERVATFYSRYFGAEDTPYAHAVSLYTWTAMAGRVLQPGCQADMVAVLVGDQGIGKTRGVSAMVPAPEHVAAINLDVRDADTARLLRGTLVGEIGELRGLHTRDSESIKDFISRTHERWVPKFKEFSQFFPRRVVFIGTTNQDEFLADDTGNRRWLPLRVTRCEPERIAADHEQLWAEAAVLWLLEGVAFAEAQRLAPAMHAEHMLTDPWQEATNAWLIEPEMASDIPRGQLPVSLDHAMKGALGLDARGMGMSQKKRMGAVFRALGFEKRVTRTGNGVEKLWHRKGKK